MSFGLTSIDSIYKENSSMTKTQIESLLKKDLLIDAKTCVRYGLVGETKDIDLTDECVMPGGMWGLSY